MSSRLPFFLLGVCGLLALLLFATTSCSLPYQQRWKKVAQTPATTAPTTLEGAWVGTWRSEGTGHHGKLKAIVTPATGSSDVWDFHYHATWAKILSGGYTTQHKAEEKSPGNFIISGEHDLGKLFGGVFRYDGAATPEHFKANYRSSNDHGVFELERPAATK